MSDGGSGGALSNNVTLNPLLAGATKVWASYCDGGGFSGHLEAPVVINATTTLYFRGAYILEAIVDTLLREYNLADAARVVLKGCSAGGMATYYSADPVAAQIAAAAAPAPGPALYAFPGAGFILDIPAYSGVNNIGPMIEWVFNAHNSSGAVSAACLSARAPGTEYLCMFPLFSLPYVRSPVFVANSIGDAAQLGVVSFPRVWEKGWRWDRATFLQTKSSTKLRPLSSPRNHIWRTELRRSWNCRVILRWAIAMRASSPTLTPSACS